MRHLTLALRWLQCSRRTNHGDHDRTTKQQDEAQRFRAEARTRGCAQLTSRQERDEAELEEEVTMSEYDKELQSDSEEVDDAQKALGRDARDAGRDARDASRNASDKRRDDDARVKPDDHPSETRDE
jgi:hypothetical protein